MTREDCAGIELDQGDSTAVCTGDHTATVHVVIIVAENEPVFGHSHASPLLISGGLGDENETNETTGLNESD